MDGAGSVMYECLHHPWELQLLPSDGAEPADGNTSAFAHDGGWATNTAGVSSSSSSPSSSSSRVTFDVSWMVDSTDQLTDGAQQQAPRHAAGSATSNVFGFDGGNVMDATPSGAKRPRAHAPPQHGAKEEAATETNKKRTGGAKAVAMTPPKEPQRSAAKNRRERVNERLKVLQELVPNGRKLDMVTMLDKAITYVKFMQLQLKVLETDAFWPTQGGKAPEMSQVKEALDAILLSASSSTQCDQRLSF